MDSVIKPPKFSASFDSVEVGRVEVVSPGGVPSVQVPVAARTCTHRGSVDRLTPASVIEFVM